MTRLESEIAGAPCDVDDVDSLRTAIPALCALPPGFITRLWRDFSEDNYSAGYMRMDAETIEAFRCWLSREV